jgi:integrase
MILAATALRISDVASLQVGDVDLLRGLLTVRRQTAVVPPSSGVSEDRVIRNVSSPACWAFLCRHRWAFPVGLWITGVGRLIRFQA